MSTSPPASPATSVSSATSIRATPKSVSKLRRAIDDSTEQINSGKNKPTDTPPRSRSPSASSVEGSSSKRSRSPSYMSTSKSHRSSRSGSRQCSDDEMVEYYDDDNDHESVKMKRRNYQARRSSRSYQISEPESESEPEDESTTKPKRKLKSGRSRSPSGTTQYDIKEDKEDGIQEEESDYATHIRKKLDKMIISDDEAEVTREDKKKKAIDELEDAIKHLKIQAGNTNKQFKEDYERILKQQIQELEDKINYEVTERHEKDKRIQELEIMVKSLRETASQTLEKDKRIQELDKRIQELEILVLRENASQTPKNIIEMISMMDMKQIDVDHTRRILKNVRDVSKLEERCGKHEIKLRTYLENIKEFIDKYLKSKAEVHVCGKLLCAAEAAEAAFD